jgi:formylmethanofuran dehydrogenase subunit E
MKRYLPAVLIVLLASPALAETPDEWVALGTRVHGGFGSFIPLGIKIGLDASERLKAQPRELSITYYDSDKSPCACFADGIAIATYASVGQRTLTIAQEKAPG